MRIKKFPHPSRNNNKLLVCDCMYSLGMLYRVIIKLAEEIVEECSMIIIIILL